MIDYIEQHGSGDSLRFAGIPEKNTTMITQVQLSLRSEVR